MGNVFYFGWELSFMEGLQGLANPVLTAVFTVFTMMGEEIPLVGLLGFLYWSWHKEWGKKASTGLLMAVVLAPMLKNVALRRRPYMDNPSIRCLRAPDHHADIYDVAAMGYSLPSMHASNTMSQLGGLARCARQRAVSIVCTVVVLMVSLSRVYLGVHYPTDILAGWAVAILSILVMDWVTARVKSYLAIALILGAAGLPGWFFCTSNDFFTSYGIMLGILLGFHFEEKWVHFSDTTVLWQRAVRLVGGMAFFMVLSVLLKVPFPKELLEGAGLAAHLVRTGRYLVMSFLVVGVYPITFRWMEKK